MKKYRICLIALLAGFSHLPAKLVFTDTFDRVDGSAKEDAVGNGWITNSASRAEGEKQAFLKDETLTIIRHEKANHAVSVKRDFLLGDCKVSLKFKVGEGDRLGVNFNDPELKTSHAGHVCSIRVSTSEVSVADQMNGTMNLALREKRLSGNMSEEDKHLIAKTEKKADILLKPGRWHELTFELMEDTVKVYINSVFQLEHRSPGFAHPTKRNIALSVPQQAVVDDFKVWNEAGGK